MPGIGSINTLIGFLPAWRAIPTAAAAGIMAAKTAADIAVKAAEATTLAAAGTPGAPAALAAEQTLKASTLASMSSTIMSASGGADIHACVTPAPVPPHGPGVVIDGSPTVLINNLPAARMGDTIIEPLGPPNKIAMGCPTVIIGNTGSGPGGGGGGGGAGPTNFTPVNVSHIEASWDKGGGELGKGVPPASAAPPSGSASATSTPAIALASAAVTGTPAVECNDPACKALRNAAA